MVWSVRVPADWNRYGHWYVMVGYGMVSVGYCRLAQLWSLVWYGWVWYGMVSAGACRLAKVWSLVWYGRVGYGPCRLLKTGTGMARGQGTLVLV